MKNKRNDGITLISLVVTIIVLLILAGISIMMLTGNNGILDKAGEAKNITEKESVREQIKLEVLGALDTNGEVNLQELKEKLSIINADVSSFDDIIIDNSKTGKIALNGYDFYVDNNNSVLDYSEPEKTPIPKQSENTAFSRANGRIDIVFLNGTGYSVTNTPNKPALDNTMVPVYYDETNLVWKVCSATDTTNWYNYEAEDVSKAGTAQGDTHKNRWANVMLTDFIEVEKDSTTYTTAQIKSLLSANNLSQIVGATVTTEGSMLVWIPRYAYKITYYNEPAKINIIGYSDSRGFVDKEGKTPSNMQTPTTSINANGTIETKTYEYYRPHPVFETDLNQGGWKKRITGIWVGKFEATGSEAQVTTIATTNTTVLQSRKIGVLWNALKNSFKAGTTESHMMKNSEWGAICYFVESKFGRNEVIVTQNNSYSIGAGNYKNNQNQSSTGNIYGVYDIVGGTCEYVASYIANNKNANGYQFASIDGFATTNNNKTESTPYSTVYQVDSTLDSSSNNYALSLNRVFGDAICETMKVERNGLQTAYSWHSALSDFVYSSYSFFKRGSSNGSGNMGMFSFEPADGRSYIGCGSRVVCIVK